MSFVKCPICKAQNYYCGRPTVIVKCSCGNSFTVVSGAAVPLPGTRPVQHTTYPKRREDDDTLAVGVAAALVGTAVGYAVSHATRHHDDDERGSDWGSSDSYGGSDDFGGGRI